MTDDGRIVTIMARELARQSLGGSVATLLRIVGYITVPIETLSQGDYVISRDQNDPSRI